jgi:predicted nucleic acid-binding protein
MTIVTAPTGTELILVDSSGWLEALTGDTRAEQFHPYLEKEDQLLIPTIVIYEVLKKLRGALDPSISDRFLSHALRGRVVPLDEHLAIAAAEFSLRRRLAMADAIIYATARSLGAQLITSDTAFANIPGVTLI